MLLQNIDISVTSNYDLIESVVSKGNHHLSDTGDYGYYIYRRKPYFYVRKLGCTCLFFSCFWFTIKKDKIERFPSGDKIMDFFLYWTEIKNLINKLK